MSLKRLFGILLLTTATMSPMRAQERGYQVEWITLGTSGGPNVVADRAQIANAFAVNGSFYLFDVGNGTRRQLVRSGLRLADVRGIFISHHHIDHVAELGQLLVSRWLGNPDNSSLPVLGPDGVSVLVNGLVAAYAPTVQASYTILDRAPLPTFAHTVLARDIPFLDSPSLVFEDENIRVFAITVDHFQIPPNVAVENLPHAVAYRIEAGGRSFVFSGDTGVSTSLETLAEGADVLVTEIVDPKGIAASVRRRSGSSESTSSLITSITTNHLSPDAIGTLAAAAKVKKVVLTHYVGFDDDSDLSAIGAVYEGPVVLARDLDRF